MQPQWYYRRKDRLFGPLGTEELEHLVVRHELFPTDTVRLGQSGEWLPATQIIDTFLGTNGLAEPEAAASAGKVISEIASGRTLRKNRAESRPVSRSWAAMSMATTLHSTGMICGNLLSNLGEAGTRFLALRHNKFTLVCILLCGAAYALRNVNFLGPDATTAAMNQMIAMAEELDLQQGSNASPQNAKRFSDTALTTLTPLLKELQQQAARSPRLRSHYFSEAGYRESIARSHLIQAGLVLREMLASGGGDATMRGNFQVRLASARRELGQGNVLSEANGPTDPLTIGVIVADALLVAGGGLWWWKRSRK